VDISYGMPRITMRCRRPSIRELFGNHNGVAQRYGTGSNAKPSPQRFILPEDGDGKCAVQSNVDVSHRPPNRLRRVSPAC
jgi:hypothetical protein